MSAKSDKYEKDVAEFISESRNVHSYRPKVGTDYPDVIVEYTGSKAGITKESVYIEVKMNHTDNLANPRLYYEGGKWKTTYTTPVAHTAVKYMNRSLSAKKWMMGLAKYCKIPFKDLYLPTTFGEYKKGVKAGVSPKVKEVIAYVESAGITRYLHTTENMNMSDEIIAHYTEGKSAIAHYMGAGDDFYRLSGTNPLKVPNDVPMLSGKGDFSIRVSTRSEYYEIQVEAKIKKLDSSRYSVMPGTSKKNPFQHLAKG